MTGQLFAAVDLGATSGRVMVARLDDGRFDLEQVHRFPTPSLTEDFHLHWDAGALRQQILHGLARAAEWGRLSGIGIDTWGVDYGRLNGDGQLLEPPFHYRDRRTDQTPERFHALYSADRLYAEAGLQTLSFNTIFQLACSADDPGWAATEDLLFLPDLFAYWLTGAKAAELTIASTSGLLDVTRRDWSAATLAHLRDHLGLDLTGRLAPITEPGALIGATRPELGLGETPVVAVASHDTASAVAAVPAWGNFAYISSGTWSLVGLELDQPILTPASRRAGFTNELGVDATVRYLRNVMGLWALTESQRHWTASGRDIALTTLLYAAALLPALRTVVDMEDPRLLPPGDMPARIAEMARETGQPTPASRAEYARCILDSLALDYRRTIRQACQLANRPVDAVHIVGGGVRNLLLNQLTASATGLPVVAGPAEATALGNVLVQARATGAIHGDLADLRQYALASAHLTHYQPASHGPSQAEWAAAERRLWAD